MEPSTKQDVLPECERLLRAAFAHAAIGMAIVDTRGVFIYANEALCLMGGYDERDFHRLNFVDTLHPDDRAERIDVFRQVVAGEIGSYVSERRLLRKDESLRWVRVSVTAPNKQTQPVQVIALVEDITEHKQAEDALRASEERFRIAAENASDTIYEWDLPSGQVAVFGKGDHLMGDWPAPPNIEAWKSLVPREDLERILPEFERYIQSGERYSGEFRIIGQNGKTYHYSNRGQAIRNAADQPYKWIGLATDITEKKQAEEATSQLAAIVRCSDDAIVATDTAGKITTWNDGAQQLLGYTAIQVKSLPIASLFPSTDLAEEVVSRIRHGQSSRLDDAHFRRIDGSTVPVLLSVSPIYNPDGQVIGSAIIARDISARKQAEQEMAHRALHDHLTGLPNRLSLADSLATILASTDLDVCGTAVIFVDLDGFKFVNDTLGHDAGDILLQQVARRLSACVRKGDLLARMGGDEFMVVVNGVTEDQVALAVGQRLSVALRAPFNVAGHELVITASMGISIYPRDGTDVSTLRRNADTAMYQAKQTGKDRIHFYRPALGAAFQARLEMEMDLRHALDRGDLLVYYQPVFTAADKRLTAYEALCRWPHPNFGFVPPNKFIALAEETGLIIRLGEWVLREACCQCRRWQEPGKASVRVAVNVSPLQFARPNFVDMVLGVLRETRLSGDLLDLELTESILMRDVQSATEKMANLRMHGVRISVDDFGTGYSSLGYLPKLPIDILKIDRCFVTQIGENNASLRLIQAMISLAHSIGKRVIVEGVETPTQLELLRKMRCDEVQGFLLGRPGRLTRYDERPQEVSSEMLIA